MAAVLPAQSRLAVGSHTCIVYTERLIDRLRCRKRETTVLANFVRLSGEHDVVARFCIQTRARGSHGVAKWGLRSSVRGHMSKMHSFVHACPIFSA